MEAAQAEEGQARPHPAGTLRPLSVGEILDGSFAIYRRNFPVIYGTMVLAFTPSFILCILGGPIGIGLARILAGISQQVCFAAAIQQVSDVALGGRPGVSHGLKTGLRRFFPLLLAEFVAGVLVILGLFLLIVPGVLLWIMFFAVPPVVVLEKNLQTCLQRSWAIAQGSKRKIFLVNLVAVLIAILPTTVFQVPQIISEYSHPNLARSPSPLLLVLVFLVAALVVPFSMGVTTLLYYDQRVRKEGLDVQLAASAFEELRPPAAPPATSPQVLP